MSDSMFFESVDLHKTLDFNSNLWTVAIGE